MKRKPTMQLKGTTFPPLNPLQSVPASALTGTSLALRLKKRLKPSLWRDSPEAAQNSYSSSSGDATRPILPAALNYWAAKMCGCHFLAHLYLHRDDHPVHWVSFEHKIGGVKAHTKVVMRWHCPHEILSVNSENPKFQETCEIQADRKKILSKIVWGKVNKVQQITMWMNMFYVL